LDKVKMGMKLLKNWGLSSVNIAFVHGGRVLSETRFFVWWIVFRFGLAKGHGNAVSLRIQCFVSVVGCVTVKNHCTAALYYWLSRTALPGQDFSYQRQDSGGYFSRHRQDTQSQQAEY
jgi:hypothetical protein